MPETEFSNYSQNGEDGILLYLASVLDMTEGRTVEIGAGDGIECCSANLILHHGWTGLLLDGDEDLVLRGRRFYASQPETVRIPPVVKPAWVTKANVCDLLDREGYADGVDLLCLDLDGVDYWVLRELELRPAIIVVEYNNRIPADVAVTIPYSPTFTVSQDGDMTHGRGYFGASLLAYDRLLQRRGYRLVGANRVNTNAFFVDKVRLPATLPVRTVESCLGSEWARLQEARWWPSLRSAEWVEVGDG